MSRLKKASLGFIAVVTLLFITWLLINVGEGTLSREAKERLSSRKPVPEDLLEGFKYESGLFAAADDDVLEAGSKFYLAAVSREPGQPVRAPDSLKMTRDPRWCSRNSDYCSSLDRKLHEKEIAQLLSENALLLKRFDHLQTYRGAAGNLKPSVAVKRNTLELSSLTALKRLQWSERLARHDNDQSVFAEWKRLNEFVQTTLTYSPTVSDALIGLRILKSNRGFMNSAMSDLPRLKPSAEILQSAVLKVSDSAIESAVRLGELEALQEMTQMALKDGFFNLAGTTPPQFDFMKLGEPWFRRNQTISEAERRLTKQLSDPCMTSESWCDRREYLTFSESIQNPLGNFAVSVMTAYIPDRIKDLRKKAAELRKPFSAKEPSS